MSGFRPGQCLGQSTVRGGSGATSIIASTFSHCPFHRCARGAKILLSWYAISWTNMLGAWIGVLKLFLPKR